MWVSLISWCGTPPVIINQFWFSFSQTVDNINHAFSSWRMKFWLLDLDGRVMQWEIFLVLDSRLSKSLVYPCWLCSRRRRRSPDLNFVMVEVLGNLCWLFYWKFNSSTYDEFTSFGKLLLDGFPKIESHFELLMNFVKPSCFIIVYYIKIFFVSLIICGI